MDQPPAAGGTTHGRPVRVLGTDDPPGDSTGPPGSKSAIYDCYTHVYVPPALDAVDALAAGGGTAHERPVLVLGADEARLSTNAQIDETPAGARELTTHRRPEPDLHLPPAPAPLD